MRSPVAESTEAVSEARHVSSLCSRQLINHHITLITFFLTTPSFHNHLQLSQQRQSHKPDINVCSYVPPFELGGNRKLTNLAEAFFLVRKLCCMQGAGPGRGRGEPGNEATYSTFCVQKKCGRATGDVCSHLHHTASWLLNCHMSIYLPQDMYNYGHYKLCRPARGQIMNFYSPRVA